MYRDHCPVIASAMRRDVHTFRRGVLFAVLSIRMPVRMVPAMLDDVTLTGRDSVYLMGYKRHAYDHVQIWGEAMWRDVCALPLSEPARAIERLMVCPGLGIVKAGFVAQLAGFDVACLDSRNAEREGTSRRRYEVDKHRSRSVLRFVARYVEETQGRAEEYWDAWCTFVAPDHGLTPDGVSALHMAIVDCPF